MVSQEAEVDGDAQRALREGSLYSLGFDTFSCDDISTITLDVCASYIPPLLPLN